ncbi:MAG: contractile injection system tape measure protein, partial [Phormidesmis sp.]
MSRFQSHLIGRIVLDVETAEPEDEVWALQEALSQLIQQQASSEISALFDQWVNSDEVIRLDDLTLELPPIEYDQLANDFIPHLLEALRYALADRFPQKTTRAVQSFQDLSTEPLQSLPQDSSTSASQIPSLSSPSSDQLTVPSQSASAADWEVLVYFLEYGRLPWWQDSAPFSDWVALWEAALNSNAFSALPGSALARSPLQKLLATQPTARQRLITQLPPSFFQKLVVRWQPAWTVWPALFENVQVLIQFANAHPWRPQGHAAGSPTINSVTIQYADIKYLEQQAQLILCEQLAVHSTQNASFPLRAWIEAWLPKFVQVILRHRRDRAISPNDSFHAASLHAYLTHAVDTLKLTRSSVWHAAISRHVPAVTATTTIPRAATTPANRLLATTTEESLSQTTEASFPQPPELPDLDAQDAISLSQASSGGGEQSFAEGQAASSTQQPLPVSKQNVAASKPASASPEFAMGSSEATTDSFSEATTDSFSEATTDSFSEATTDSFSEPITDSSSEAITDSFSEPITDSSSELTQISPETTQPSFASASVSPEVTATSQEAAQPADESVHSFQEVTSSPIFRELPPSSADVESAPTSTSSAVGAGSRETIRPSDEFVPPLPESNPAAAASAQSSSETTQPSSSAPTSTSQDVGSAFEAVSEAAAEAAFEVASEAVSGAASEVADQSNDESPQLFSESARVFPEPTQLSSEPVQSSAESAQIFSAQAESASDEMSVVSEQDLPQANQDSQLPNQGVATTQQDASLAVPDPSSFVQDSSLQEPFLVVELGAEPVSIASNEMRSDENRSVVEHSDEMIFDGDNSVSERSVSERSVSEPDPTSTFLEIETTTFQDLNQPSFESTQSTSESDFRSSESLRVSSESAQSSFMQAASSPDIPNDSPPPTDDTLPNNTLPNQQITPDAEEAASLPPLSAPAENDDAMQATSLSETEAIATPIDIENEREIPAHPLISNPPKRAVFPNLSRDEIANGIYLNNAGLVLLHPFLKIYFDDIGLLTEDDLANEFRNEYAQQQAIALLHYLATGQTNAP